MWEYYYPDCLEYSDDLYHHGTKGMKWGVRRYQNKDGSLTAAGKKRRSLGQVIRDHKTKKKRKAALEKAREAKAAKKKAEDKAKKAEEKRQKALEKGRLSTRKMTDEELKAYKTRLQTEKDIKDLVMETRPMKRLMSKMWSDAIVPGITEGGKDLIKSTIKKYGGDALGLDGKKVKSEYDRIKEEADIAKFKKQKFEDERDLAEGKKNYQSFLNDPEAQAAARQKYKDSQTGTKNNNKKNKGGNNQASDNDSSSKQESKENTSNSQEAKTSGGNGGGRKGMKWGVREAQEYTESSKANSTALSTVRNSESTQKAQAWVEDSRTGEILRNTTVKVDEED